VTWRRRGRSVLTWYRGEERRGIGSLVLSSARLTVFRGPGRQSLECRFHGRIKSTDYRGPLQVGLGLPSVVRASLISDSTGPDVRQSNIVFIPVTDPR